MILNMGDTRVSGSVLILGLNCITYEEHLNSFSCNEPHRHN